MFIFYYVSVSVKYALFIIIICKKKKYLLIQRNQFETTHFNVLFNLFSCINNKNVQQMPQEDEEGEDEEMGVAETYADYWPAKCNYNIFFLN